MWTKYSEISKIPDTLGVTETVFNIWRCLLFGGITMAAQLLYEQ